MSNTLKYCYINETPDDVKFILRSNLGPTFERFLRICISRIEADLADISMEDETKHLQTYRKLQTEKDQLNEFIDFVQYLNKLPEA